ncbi:MAG: hypothetical protein H6734_00355 [Alphaproteobacteria bacterium]|nr:hypothetical protein [Alphaproteobacteria bacterium]
MLTVVLPLFLGCSAASGRPLPASSAPSGFWDHWGDGRAELAGYRLEQGRYGKERPGEAVLVFVTEDFTDGARVKSDGGHGDEYPVLKLNETRDFQTGIYDYNVMTSAFVRLDGKDRLGTPTKVSFSSQEWCGHVYDQLLTHGDRYDRTSHSYFDGEADRSSSLAIPDRAVFLDAMPIVVRGLAGTLAEPGASIEVAVHPRLVDLRFGHRDASWDPGTYSVAAETHEATVPAGTFAVRTHSLTVAAGTWTWDVEEQAPHRLVRWTSPTEKAELTGAIREPYWRQNGPGGLEKRDGLGLPRPSWAR